MRISIFSITLGLALAPLLGLAQPIPTPQSYTAGSTASSVISNNRGGSKMAPKWTTMAIEAASKLGSTDPAKQPATTRTAGSSSFGRHNGYLGATEGSEKSWSTAATAGSDVPSPAATRPRVQPVGQMRPAQRPPTAVSKASRQPVKQPAGRGTPVTTAASGSSKAPRPVPNQQQRHRKWTSSHTVTSENPQNAYDPSKESADEFEDDARLLSQMSNPSATGVAKQASAAGMPATDVPATGPVTPAGKNVAKPAKPAKQVTFALS